MKRRRINLFTLSLAKFDFDTAAKKIQFSMIWILILLVVALGASVFINKYLTDEQDKLTKSKTPLNTYLQNNAEYDKKIKQFIYKNNLLKEYIKEDANAFVHYTELFLHIQNVSPEAKIQSFTVDKVGQTKFEINFPNYDSAQVFLNALETPEFIKPFEFLKLAEFDVSGSKTDEFILMLEGKFIKK